jgi:HSP20 family protein
MSDKEVTTTNSAAADKSAAYIVPRVDVVEDSMGITLLADLPGVPKDGLDIKVEGTSLTLEGAIKLDTPKGLDPVFAEVRAARYRRAFTLSRELDSAAIDAQLRNGVLRLRIPKVAEAQPRRIEVRAG